MRIKQKNIPFYEAMKAVMEGGNGAVRARCRKWINKEAYLEKHENKLFCAWEPYELSIEDLNAKWDLLE